jgi:GntR family transcriptional repressor for pyruvate dehydrogenase complex
MARTEKVADVVARAIVRDAAASRVPAGTSLGLESEMMGRYRVSRGSLREALRILEVLGFVELRRGPAGGPVLLDADVGQFSSVATLHYQRVNATYEELLEMRLILEPAAAALCAERRSTREAKVLRSYLADAAAVDVDDDRAFRQVGQGFHELVAAMSGNRLLNLVVRSCYDVFAGRTSQFIYPARKRHVVCQAHEDIAQAILERDPERARALMEVHMRDYIAQADKQFHGVMDETVQW